MDYRVWAAVLEAYCKFKTNPKTIAELKEALQVIWGNLPQGPIDKAVKDLDKDLVSDWRLVLELEAGTSIPILTEMYLFRYP